MIRTKKIPFVQSWASVPVIVMTSLIIIIGLIIPFTPLAETLYMVPLPPAYFFWLLGILIAYSLLIEVVKRWYVRSEEHTSELQSRGHLVCRLLLEKKKKE